MARKEKKYHFIYKTTNLLNGRYYIGMHSTFNLEDGYMGSGKRLKRSLNKYGKENHKVEILEFVDNRKILKQREREIVNLNEVAKKECMNLMIGGQGGFVDKQHELKCKQGRIKWLKNQWKDEEFRNKIINLSAQRMVEHHKNGKIKYDTFTNKKHTEKSKKIMSEKRKGTGIGEKNSQFGTCWITKEGINKKIKNEELEIFIKQGWNKGRIT